MPTVARYTAQIKRLVIGSFFTLALLTLVGCDLPFSVPTTITQPGGLPTLRHLNWGASYYDHALYSPDGRWIAVLAGSDFSKSHLEVLSPDGHTQYDLSGWGCGQWRSFDYAWLPDGRLSCIRADTEKGVFMLCIGSYPFQHCDRRPLSPTIKVEAKGAVWATDGAYLLLAAYATANDKIDIRLCVTQPDGTVTQIIPADESLYQPQWRPHTATLSYIRGEDLLLSPTEWFHGQLSIGKPRLLVTQLIPDASRYAWSPSGHWLAVRSGVPGEDKIYLVNVDHPEQTIDVTSAQLPQILADPVWSPDGKTLIVMSPQYNQPYAINIADYLHSKGLDV